MANVPFTLEVEDDYINQGYLTRRQHPEFDLWILNYTQKCVAERKWDGVTQMCRGLIYNQRRQIVAWPFRKFFNLEELRGGVPNEHFTVLDKADGSLGITYPGPDGKVYLSTRGSFESAQAIRGTEFLQREFPRTAFAVGVTYLFEVICPESHYVVDYGDFQGLILIGAVDLQTGYSFDISGPLFEKFIRVEQYPISSISEVRKFVESRENSEGVVLWWPDSDFRVKIKSSRYLEIFGIISGWNPRNVWESMSSGSSSIQELLTDSSLPEEFQIWLSNTSADFQLRFDEIWLSAMQAFEFRPETHSRKKLAEYFSKFKYPAILFAMLDGNMEKARKITWSIIKP